MASDMRQPKRAVKIEQIGKLVIEKNVEIGANCTIDRGAILDTEIHKSKVR